MTPDPDTPRKNPSNKTILIICLAILALASITWLQAKYTASARKQRLNAAFREATGITFDQFHTVEKLSIAFNLSLIHI